MEPPASTTKYKPSIARLRDYIITYDSHDNQAKTNK